MKSALRLYYCNKLNEPTCCICNSCCVGILILKKLNTKTTILVKIYGISIIQLRRQQTQWVEIYRGCLLNTRVGKKQKKMTFREDWEQEQLEYITNRNKSVVSIRRQNREELLWKRRLTTVKNGIQRYTATAILDPSYQSLIKELVAENVELNMADLFFELLNNDGHIEQFVGALGLRKLLIGVNQFQTIVKIRSCNIISKLYKFALQSDLPQLQYEAVWILVNIISGTENLTQEDAIIFLEIANIFDSLFDAPTHPKILQHAIWGIGNIACEEISSRKKVLSSETIKKVWKRVSETYVLEYVSPQKSLSPQLFPEQNQNVFQVKVTGEFDKTCLQSICWAFSNILRRDPEYYQPLSGQLLFFISLMFTNQVITDRSIKLQCAETISKTIDIYLLNFKDILRTRIVERIYQQLEQNDERMVRAFLRLIGVITSGSQYIADYLVSIDIFPYLATQLTSQTTVIRRETCWILSNFVSNGEPYLFYLIKMFPKLLNDLAAMFFSDQEKVRNQISYFFRNMIYASKSIDPETLVLQTGLIYGYVDLLNSTDKRILKDTLINLYAILKNGQKIANMKESRNLFALEFQRLDGINVLDRLQRHPDPKVYHTAGKILENFYEIQSTQFLLPDQN